MRIDNRTHWRTEQIRAVLQRCAEMELDPEKRAGMRVVISYRRRGGGSSGCAYVGSKWCKVRVSSDVFDVHDFAIVACHEFAHCRGMNHRQMPAYYKRAHIGGTDATHSRYDWARALTVERESASVPPAADVKAERAHAHAVKMSAIAETRAKRARTILKKWQRKTAYYERRLAAMRAVTRGEEPTR